MIALRSQFGRCGSTRSTTPPRSSDDHPPQAPRRLNKWVYNATKSAKSIQNNHHHHRQPLHCLANTLSPRYATMPLFGHKNNIREHYFKQ